MALGLVGRKLGMTRIFSEEGKSIAITVLEVLANRVVQIKTEQKEGYNSIQLTYGSKKVNKLNKAEIGHFAKSASQAGKGLIEFKILQKDLNNFKLGDNIEVSIFDNVKYIDVSGFSKGKGFAGNIKRHNFNSQRASHGNSLSHKAPGSIGQCQDPGRVFKGKKMPGHLGNKKVTTKNLEIIKIDKSKNLILVKGSIPGSNNSDISIIPSIKLGVHNGT